jgi:hypothetical protein
VDSGQLRVAIDSIFALAEAAAAFERSLASGKHGKVVIGRVAPCYLVVSKQAQPVIIIRSNQLTGSASWRQMGGSGSSTSVCRNRCW